MKITSCLTSWNYSSVILIKFNMTYFELSTTVVYNDEFWGTSSCYFLKQILILAPIFVKGEITLDELKIAFSNALFQTWDNLQKKIRCVSMRILNNHFLHQRNEDEAFLRLFETPSKWNFSKDPSEGYCRGEKSKVVFYLLEISSFVLTVWIIWYLIFFRERISIYFRRWVCCELFVNISNERLFTYARHNTYLVSIWHRCKFPASSHLTAYINLAKGCHFSKSCVCLL